MDRSAVIEPRFGLLTGSHGPLDRDRVITYPLDRYEIAVRVTSDYRFIGVESIKIRREFASEFLKANPKGHIDVDDIYLDNEKPKE